MRVMIEEFIGFYSVWLVELGLPLKFLSCGCFVVSSPDNSLFSANYLQIVVLTSY